MKRTSLVLALLCLVTGSAFSQTVPQVLNFQGRLAKPDGTPVSDASAQTVTFRLFAASSGGSVLWQQVSNSVAVHNGTFAVPLNFAAGYQNGATLATVFGNPLFTPYLEIQLGSAAALSPRQPFASVAYALYALSVPNGSITNANIAAGTLTADRFAPGVLSGGGWSLTGNAGINPLTQFLGTTDNNPLVFKVNNHQAMQYSYAENLNNGSSHRSVNAQGGSDINSITAGAIGATISGGGRNGFNASAGDDQPNRVVADFGTVGGGFGNTANASATIGGGVNNTAGSGATVAGGFSNLANGNTATIAGGNNNTASGIYATVNGGEGNFATGYVSTVAGGASNTAAGQISFAAGQQAQANHDGTFVWNDSSDLIFGHNFASTAPNQFLIHAAGGVGINTNNPAGFALAVNGNAQISGAGNGLTFPDGTTQTTAATGTGWNLTGNAGINPATNFLGTTDNNPLVIKVNNHQAMQYSYAEITGLYGYRSIDVLGGSDINNIATGVIGATIAGGGFNGFNFSAGLNEPNRVTANFGTIGGGSNNTASSSYATIAGGEYNTASGVWATVTGGEYNTASGQEAIVSGGFNNLANGEDAIVGAGAANTAGNFSIVGAGTYNTASGNFSIVGGGAENTASGNYATVVGGEYNTAGGQYSFAGGQYAHANHDGSFVWNDDSNFTVPFASTAPNQFLVHAAGGVGINTNTTSGYALNVNGPINTNGILSASVLSANFANVTNNLTIANNSIAAGEIGIGTTSPTANLDVYAGSLQTFAGANLRISRQAGLTANNVRLETNLYRYVPGNDWTTTSILLQRWTDATPQALIALDGNNVGIGTYTASTTLDVNGNITERGTDFILNGRGGGQGNNSHSARALVDDGYAGLYVNFGNDFGKTTVDSDLQVNGSVHQSSDVRYKTNILTLNNALDDLLNLRGVSYDWDRAKWPAKNFSKGKQVGFIAQELERIFPELVDTDKDGYKSVNYIGVVPVLAEAVKTLNAKVQEKQKQIDALNAKVDRLSVIEKENADIKKQLLELVAALKKMQEAQNR